MLAVTVAEALRDAARRLAEVSDTARLDAELLMAHALDVSRSELLLRRLGETAPAGFAALVERRAAHEPVAYVIGRQEFYGLDLEMTPAVLIPRADSETIIEAARDTFARRAPPRRVLDLGTGSGALLLAALTVWPDALGVGTDRSPEALAVAMRNAERVGINCPPAPEMAATHGADLRGADVQPGRVTFLQRDWHAHGWREDLGRFDLILANPPYVETSAELAPGVRDFEPAGALFAGPVGLDDYRVLIPQLARLLEPGGSGVLEIGAGQGGAVRAIAQAAGFTAEIKPDLAGRSRALVLAI